MTKEQLEQEFTAIQNHVSSIPSVAGLYLNDVKAWASELVKERDAARELLKEAARELAPHEFSANTPGVCNLCGKSGMMTWDPPCPESPNKRLIQRISKTLKG